MTIQAEYWNVNSPGDRRRNPEAPVDAEEEMLTFYDSSMSSYNRLQLVVFENGLENTNMLDDGDAIVIEIKASDEGRKYKSCYVTHPL